MENSIPFKDWRIVREIGRGSYGRVYEIERDFYGKTLKSAMKVIPIPTDEGALDNLYGSGFDDKSVSTWCRQRLNDILSEYSLMESLKGYTNIVSVDDVEVVERKDSPGYYVYIRMELLTSLQRKLREVEFTEEDVIKLGKDICRALIICEEHKIIHRDIKPENIMVSEHGDYKLGDFGVARQLEHTMSATVAGSERYMAPEVIKREKYGRDVDTYSLGVVMYRLLNKRTMPFMKIGELPSAQDVSAAQARRLSGEPFPAPAEGSEELVRIVLKACSFDRANRYSSAADMLRDLEALPVAEEEQIPDPVIYEPAPKKKPDPVDTFSEEDETVTMVSPGGTGGSGMNAGKKLKEASAKSSKASLILYIGSIATILMWILRPVLEKNFITPEVNGALVIAIGTVIFGAGMQRRNWTETFTGRMIAAAGCILIILYIAIIAPSEIYILDWSGFLMLVPWAAAVLIYGIAWFTLKLRLPDRTDPAWAAYSSKPGTAAFRNIAIIMAAARAALTPVEVYESITSDGMSSVAAIISIIPAALFILLIIGVLKHNKAILLAATGGLFAVMVLYRIQEAAYVINTYGLDLEEFLWSIPAYMAILALAVLFYELLKGPDNKTHIRIAVILSLFTVYLVEAVRNSLNGIADGGNFADIVIFYGIDLLDAALYIMITLMIRSRLKEDGEILLRQGRA